MSIELERLENAIGDFDLQADDDQVDPKRLSATIDRLQGKLCRVLNRGRERGDHRLAGLSPPPGQLAPVASRARQPPIGCVSAGSSAPCPRPRPPSPAAPSATRPPLRSATCAS